MKQNKTDNDLSGKKSNQNKLSQFNYNWIYVLLLIGLLILFFTQKNNEIQETTWLKFKNEMLLNHDVEKINIVNQELVEVFIKKGSLSKEKFKGVTSRKDFLQLQKPHYYFSIGSIDFFEQQLKEAQINFSDEEKVNEVYIKRDSFELFYF
jgi:cell division protease FtsH